MANLLKTAILVALLCVRLDAGETDALVISHQGPGGDTEFSLGSAGQASSDTNSGTAQATTTSPALVFPQVGCQCGEDCVCFDEMICRAGDCKSNYAVMFTATWCTVCHKMYPTVEKLRKEGYIVYVFDIDKYPQAAAKGAPDKLPTTVFFSNGQEVGRVQGLVSESDFRAQIAPRVAKTVSIPDAPYLLY